MSGTKTTVIHNNVDFSRHRIKSVVVHIAMGFRAPTLMVNGTLSWLRRPVVMGALALILVSSTIHCKEVSETGLAAGLSVMLPESLAVHEYYRNDADEFPILIGEIDGEPAYFLGAVRVKRWERSNVLWTKLETELRYIDPSDNLSVIARGGFTTDGGQKVRYRGYRFRHKEGFRRQVYFLLRSDTQIYWLTLTAVEGADLAVVIPLAQALIRRAHLVEEARQDSSY